MFSLDSDTDTVSALYVVHKNLGKGGLESQNHLNDKTDTFSLLSATSHTSPCVLQDPVQEWGEEFEDGAVYGITLRRESVPAVADANEAMPSNSFVQYRTCKMRRLKAATLERLVSQLVDPPLNSAERDFAHIFLSTYRSFTNTSTLIELIFNR